MWCVRDKCGLPLQLNLQHIRKLFCRGILKVFLRCGFHLPALANKGFETEGFKDLGVSSVVSGSDFLPPLTFWVPRK